MTAVALARSPSLFFALAMFGYPVFASIASILLPALVSVGGLAHRGLVVVLALPYVAAFLAGKDRAHATGFWLLLGCVWAGLFLRLLREILAGVPVPLAQENPERAILLFVGAMVLPPIGLALARVAEQDGVQFYRHCTIVVWVATWLTAAASLVLAPGYAAQILGRASTESMSPIVVGHLGVSCVVLSLFGEYQTKLMKLVRLPCIVLGLGLIAMSGSRGPLLTLVVLLGFACVRFLVLRWKMWALAWPGLICGFLLLPGFLSHPALAGTPVAQRLALSSVINERATGRAGFLPAIWEMLYEEPVLGAGMSDPITRQHPHNIVLESFFTMGIVGGALFVVMVLYTIWRGRVLITSGGHWSWVGFLYLQFLVFGLMSSSLYLLEQFWCMTVVVVSICEGQAQEVS